MVGNLLGLGLCVGAGVSGVIPVTALTDPRPGFEGQYITDPRPGFEGQYVTTPEGIA